MENMENNQNKQGGSKKKGCLMGCLIALGVVILTTVLVIVGGIYLVKQNVQLEMNEQQTQSLSQELTGLKDAPEGYIQEKAFSVIGVKGIIYGIDDSTQKMFVINPGWVVNITKEDLESDNVEEYIKELMSEIQKKAPSENRNIELENIELVGKGYMNTMGQEVPYVELYLTMFDNKKNQEIQLEGILSIAEKNGKSIILLSGDVPENYNENLAKDFFFALY